MRLQACNLYGLYFVKNIFKVYYFFNSLLFLSKIHEKLFDKQIAILANNVNKI